SDVLSDKFESLEGPLETQHLLISYLLPPAVKAFIKQCDQELETLCGKRYEHDGNVNQRWGTQKGSIILANQQVALERPRVRTKAGKEIELQTYQEFQNPELFDQAVFTEGLKKVSQRDYQKGIRKIANSFGFKKSAISKRWINATAGKIKEL